MVSNSQYFLGLGVEAGALPMYPQKMRVSPWVWKDLSIYILSSLIIILFSKISFCYSKYIHGDALDKYVQKFEKKIFSAKKYI